MKHYHKIIRCLALLLAAALFFGLVPMNASAEEESVNLMRTPQKLEEVEPEKGAEEPFWGQYSIPRRWVTTIEFHDTKEEAPANILDFSAGNDKSVIGWYTPGHLHLAADGKITLPEKSAWMFAYFTNLKEVNFNGAVDTSRVTDMNHMFYYCGSLEKLDLTGFDTASVTDMSNLFAWCGRLEEAEISGFDTSNVTTMSNMFAYCEKLKALDVSGFQTSKVNDFSYMFFFCRQIPELNVANFDTSSAQYMMSMFYRCEHLHGLDISGFDTSKVISMIYIDGNVGIY